jgi:hypothetical protein
MIFKTFVLKLKMNNNRGNDVKQISKKIDNDLIKKVNELEEKYHLHGGYNHTKHPGKCCMDVYQLNDVCEAFREFAYLYRCNFSDDCEIKNPCSSDNEHYLDHYVISDIIYNYRLERYTVFTTMTYNRWCQMMNIIESKAS